MNIKYGLCSAFLLLLFLTTAAQQEDSVKNKKTDTLENHAKALVLQSVTVTGKKPFIEQKIDRTIINVDALVANAGVNALDVLENAPGILISNEGTISLKGKNGVVVYIDDKPAYLSGSELNNYLKSLPSASLDKIEIMPNPPARYDAAGNAGVINIRTKKSKAGGFNGGINLTYGQGIYPRTNNSFNFNYRVGKINLFGTTSYSIYKGLNDLDIFRYYFRENGDLRSTFFQNSLIRQTYYSTNLKLGLDYQLGPSTVIGVLINGNTTPGKSHTTNRSVVAGSSGETDSVITADNLESSNWKKRSINLNYLNQFNAGREFSFDLDHIAYTTKQDQHFLNNIFGPDENFRSTDGLVGDLPSRINIWSAKGDYSRTISKDIKISAGGKVSYVTTNNAANYFTIINNIKSPDYDKTNHFQYKETINAAYVNANKDWKRLSVQAGWRLENTISDGHQLGNIQKPDSAFRRTYTSLFPTAYILYKLDSSSTNQVSFSYGKRIDRPYYQDLNPFISPLDKFSIYVGNPYLKPTFTRSLELSHIYKNRITTTFSYNVTSDIMEETIDLSNSIYISRLSNIGRSTVLGMSITCSLTPLKWWSLNLYAEVQRRHYTGLVYGYLLDTSSVYSGSNLSSQFILGKGWTAEISGSFQTGVLMGQISSLSTGRFNAGVSKKILKEKGSVKINARDIFLTGLNHGIITSTKDAYATYHNQGDTRNLSITFSYNFGKATAASRNRTTGAETEENRVKN